MLAARKLSKSYHSTVVLDGLDLEVAPGEVCCLLGHNGAGKTTTLKLLMGLLTPSSGEALVCGELVERDPVAARQHLAYVPERVDLYPELTGAENLSYFANLASAGSLSHAELAELLVECGLPPAAVDQRASNYSKGMRQKVAIALCRAKRAGALLLDEPTAGLDPQAVNDLWTSVRNESERGAAVLMVTHDLSAVAEVAQLVGVLRAGRLVYLGPTAGRTQAEIASIYRMAIDEEYSARLGTTPDNPSTVTGEAR